MMSTINIIKRTFLAAAVTLTIGLATIQTATAGVSLNDAPVVQPMVGDGQETHGGKG